MCHWGKVTIFWTFKTRNVHGHRYYEPKIRVEIRHHDSIRISRRCDIYVCVTIEDGKVFHRPIGVTMWRNRCNWIVPAFPRRLSIEGGGNPNTFKKKVKTTPSSTKTKETEHGPARKEVGGVRVVWQDRRRRRWHWQTDGRRGRRSQFELAWCAARVHDDVCLSACDPCALRVSAFR